MKAKSRLYVESSALARALLEGDEELLLRIETGALVTSELTFVELSRALLRARRDGRLDERQYRTCIDLLEEVEQKCERLALKPEILIRAREEFPQEPLRTLEALHLASIQVLHSRWPGLGVVTTDDRVGRNARALGFTVFP